MCFPDVSIDEGSTLPPELARERVLDAQDLSSDDLSARIASIYNRIPAKLPAAPYSPESFKTAIAPKLNLVPTLSDTIKQGESQLVRLTEEQHRILEFMGSNPRVVIRGGAGTGKTMIALERARRLATSGDDVLLLCYTAPLAEHLAEHVKGVRVASFYQLCKELTLEAGFNFEVPADQERQRIFWQQSIQYLLEKALETMPGRRWDHVVVDEGQDFEMDWWTSIFNLLRDKESTLWVMLDPNQNLYGCEDLTKELEGVPGDLTVNCRNTRRIAQRLSEHIPDCATTRPEAPEGEVVKRTLCTDTRSMLAEVRKTVHSLLNEHKIEADQVVILSPRIPQSSDIWKQQQFGNWRLRSLEDDYQPNTIRFSSLHRFKGLEADAVVFCEIKPDSPGCTPLHLYVGSSRAKHILYELVYGE